MIIEETLEFIPNKLPFSEEDVENFIKSKKIDPVRWAINEKRGEVFLISVSGIKN